MRLVLLRFRVSQQFESSLNLVPDVFAHLTRESHTHDGENFLSGKVFSENVAGPPFGFGFGEFLVQMVHQVEHLLLECWVLGIVLDEAVFQLAGGLSAFGRSEVVFKAINLEWVLGAVKVLDGFGKGMFLAKKLFDKDKS